MYVLTRSNTGILNNSGAKTRVVVNIMEPNLARLAKEFKSKNLQIQFIFFSFLSSCHCVMQLDFHFVTHYIVLWCLMCDYDALNYMFDTIFIPNLLFYYYMYMYL